MKKLIWALALLFSIGVFAQQPDRSVTVDAIKFRQGTSTTRDTYVVPAGETWLFDNSTTGTLQVNKGGGGWNDLAGVATELTGVATSTIIGRVTGGSGVSEELTATQVRTLLNVENGAAADQNAAEVSIADAGGIITATTVEGALQENRTAIDLNTAKTTNATHTGEVTGATALTIASGVVDSDNIVNGTIDETDLNTSVNASLDLADASLQKNTTTGNILSANTHIGLGSGSAGIDWNTANERVTISGGTSGGGDLVQLNVEGDVADLSGYSIAEIDAAGSTAIPTVEWVNANDNSGSTLLPSNDISGVDPTVNVANASMVQVLNSTGIIGTFIIEIPADATYDHADGTILYFQVDEDGAQITIQPESGVTGFTSFVLTNGIVKLRKAGNNLWRTYADDNATSVVVDGTPVNFSTGGPSLQEWLEGIDAELGTIAPGTQPFSDATALLEDSADDTKLLGFQLSGITTGTQRNWTVPDEDIDFGLRVETNTSLSNVIPIYTIAAGNEADIDGWASDSNRLDVCLDCKTVYEKTVYLTAIGSDLATGTSVNVVPITEAITITEVIAFAKTAPTGSVLTIDINEDDGSAATILSTKLTIDASERTSATAATAAVISDASIAANSFLEFDVDGVGSTTPGTTVSVVYKYTID